MLEPCRIDCPYCGENVDISVDCSAGAAQFIEDCPVCCQPIEMAIEVDLAGNLLDVQARRNDE